MFYDYKCNRCGKTVELQLSPHNVLSEQQCTCGGVMHRVYNPLHVHMNIHASRVRAYDKLPEHAKVGDTSFL